MKHTYVFGVDEAGRGPLAGPVAVGVVLVPVGFDWGLIPGVNDSKKLTEGKREVIFLEAKKLQKTGQLDYAVGLVSAKVIDKKGIVPAINTAMERALRRVSSRFDLELGDLGDFYTDVSVKLDGGLRAPEQYMHQETIIKGDGKEKVIGLASIMAKVTRDRYMRRRATLAAYQQYCFAIHKGYGTKAHREAIAKHGLSPEHRATFCRNIKSVVCYISQSS